MVGAVNLWDDVLLKVEGKVNPHSFGTWFRPTQFRALQGSALHVWVPNAQFREWLSRNYLGVIAEALQELGRGDIEVSFLSEPEKAAPAEPAEASPGS